MAKETIARVNGRDVVLMDSITEVEQTDEGKVVISASHGGASSGRYAEQYELALVLFNDAGIGKDEAGTVALGMLDAKGVAGATVSHETARIGEARDHWESGIISRVNNAARQAGIAEGTPVRTAVENDFQL